MIVLLCLISARKLLPQVFTANYVLKGLPTFHTFPYNKNVILFKMVQGY